MNICKLVINRTNIWTISGWQSARLLRWCADIPGHRRCYVGDAGAGSKTFRKIQLQVQVVELLRKEFTTWVMWWETRASRLSKVNLTQCSSGNIRQLVETWHCLLAFVTTTENWCRVSHMSVTDFTIVQSHSDSIYRWIVCRLEGNQAEATAVTCRLALKLNGRLYFWNSSLWALCSSNRLAIQTWTIQLHS